MSWEAGALMTGIRCLVLDLDGTLLNSDDMISSNNLKALEMCSAQGLPIVLATGRPPRAVRHLLSSQTLQGFVIYLDGGLTVHESSRQIIDHCPVDHRVAGEIVDWVLALEPRASISFEVQDAWYGLQSSEDPIVISQESDFAPQYTLKRADLAGMSPTRVILSGFPDVTRLGEAFSNQVRMRSVADGALIQVMARSVSKERALAPVLNALAISPEEVMVFGDGCNDQGLFDFCGYPVAMANAASSLKARAKYVTGSNDEDGVGDALNKLGLIG